MASRMADGSRVHAELVSEVCGSGANVEHLYIMGGIKYEKSHILSTQ